MGQTPTHARPRPRKQGSSFRAAKPGRGDGQDLHPVEPRLALLANPVLTSTGDLDGAEAVAEKVLAMVTTDGFHGPGDMAHL